MPLPATFYDFIGNTAAVESLRVSIAAGRFPNSLILAGPQGSGKFTLAVMLTMAIECERQPRELWSGTADRPGQALASFCGVCGNCTRLRAAAELDQLVEAAVAAREELRETDRRETRILIQQHPDVLIVPPDPPQLLIKLGQVRTVIQAAQYLPAEGPRKVFVFSSAAFMKEAANSLLKLLEEPPPHVHLILCAENPGELLPTIRSRCALVRLGALPVEEIELLLADRRPDWPPQQRALVARVAQGAAGRALNFDLEAFTSSRADALVLLRSALSSTDHTTLFKMTETYRAGAEGQARTTALLRSLSLLLEDLLLLGSGNPELVRNVDMRPDLERMGANLSFSWLENASRGVDQVYSGMRRNLLRNLSLDSFAESLADRL